jgi:hypothetical protein
MPKGRGIINKNDKLARIIYKIIRQSQKIL